MDKLGQELTDKERDALVELATHPPRRHWGILALSIGLVCLSLAGLRIASALTDTNIRVYSNQQAIRVSCTLLVNAIMQSGAASGRQSGGPNSHSPQQALNALYIRSIIRQMNSSEHADLKVLQKDIVNGGGGQVEVPDCDKIARHPEAVTIIVPR